MEFVVQKKSCDYMIENNIKREVERKAVRSSGWIMESGEWALLNASEEDRDDWTWHSGVTGF